jgi:hypothetical protein
VPATPPRDPHGEDSTRQKQAFVQGGKTSSPRKTPSRHLRKISRLIGLGRFIWTTASKLSMGRGTPSDLVGCGRIRTARGLCGEIWCASMRILRDAISLEMLKNGGRPASGIVEYDRRSNKCFLEETYIIMMTIITDQIICEVLKVIGRVAVGEGTIGAPISSVWPTGKGYSKRGSAKKPE